MLDVLGWATVALLVVVMLLVGAAAVAAAFYAIRKTWSGEKTEGSSDDSDDE